MSSQLGRVYTATLGPIYGEDAVLYPNTILRLNLDLLKVTHWASEFIKLLIVFLEI